MTDEEIIELVRRVNVMQGEAFIAVIETLAVSLHNSGAMNKAVFVEHLRETIGLRAGSDDSLVMAMLQRISADLEGRPGATSAASKNSNPEWLQGVIDGGKKPA